LDYWRERQLRTSPATECLTETRADQGFAEPTSPCVTICGVGGVSEKKCDA